MPFSSTGQLRHLNSPLNNKKIEKLPTEITLANYHNIIWTCFAADIAQNLYLDSAKISKMQVKNPIINYN